jgi:hypothetical protein
MKKILKIRKFFFWDVIEFILFVAVLALWSPRLLIEWGTDYGVYYSGSFYITTIFNSISDYKLYIEFFDHKGPVYYLFLKLVGNLIGWGYFESVISLFLSLLVLYIPIYLIVKKHTKTILSSTFFLGLALLLLYGQNANTSMAFFQSGLLIISFYLLLKSKQKYVLIYFSYFFFLLAVFTRIDSILFLIPFLIAFYTFFRVNFFRGLNILIYYILSPFVIFFALKLYFSFTFVEFYTHQFEFNIWYSKMVMSNFFVKFYRPTHYALLTGSIFLFVVTYMLICILNKKSKILHNVNNVKKKLFFRSIIENNYEEIILTSVLICSILAWTQVTDKHFHLLVLTVPLFFTVIIQSRFLLRPKYFQLVLLPIIFYGISVSLIPHWLKLTKDNFQCFRDPFCKYSPAKEYKLTVDSIRNNGFGEVHIVGGRGWTYFFSEAKPARSINDWWIYAVKEPFITEGLILSHNKLLSQKKGYIFWIDNYFFSEVSSISPLLFDILNNSILIEHQGRYSMYSIK